MPLAHNQPVGFIPTMKIAEARRFYEHTLGLHFESEDGFALVFRLGPAHGTVLRIVSVATFTPAEFTIFGWQSEHLESCLDDLSERGVQFLRFPHFDQDERGIWQAPDGTQVAWFKDPDGNTLTLSRHRR